MATELQASATTVTGQNLAGKYLAFILGGESYAIPVLKVREIIHLTSITTMPQMPDYIGGMAKVKGVVKAPLDIGRVLGAPALQN